MKKILFFAVLLCATATFAQRTCATDEKVAEMIASDPEFAIHNQEINDYIRNPDNALNRTSNASSPSVIVTIPVVFHVIYKNQNQNVSDAQINTQLTVLNNDYRKLNADFASVVPAPFQSFGADVEIVFCKATLTPAGEPTTGVTRKSVDASFDFEANYYTAAGEPAWNPSKYLNIWVGKFFDTELLGFAWPPGVAGQPKDGLCIGHNYFGTIGSAQAPFNKGRTATHEIGHYFGLAHPWGNGTCNNDDGVADTPGTSEPYYGCPSFPSYDYSCTGAEPNGSMYMNYMDYTNDACMAFFTNGQKTVMQNTLNGPRASLLTSNGCGSLGLDEASAIRAIAVYPNPVAQFFMITSPHTAIDMVEIFNVNGQLVKTQKLTDINNKIYIEEFESGVYYLRIYNEGQFLKSDKIVKK